MNIELRSIGSVNSSQSQLQDDNWDQEEVFIELNDTYHSDALYGLEEFSHVEVIFLMDKVKLEDIEKTARHPRERKDWPKVGIFAQRGKNRPNRLGLTICKVLKIEGKRLYLQGLDAVDATPVIDIKPRVEEFSPRGEVHQPKWMTELMTNYWKKS